MKKVKIRTIGNVLTKYSFNGKLENAGNDLLLHLEEQQIYTYHPIKLILVLIVFIPLDIISSVGSIYVNKDERKTLKTRVVTIKLQNKK